MTPEDRGRLRALAEKATKGPWVADGIGSDGSWEIWSAAESQHGSIICSRNGWDHRAAESRANVRLIVEAVKALPALLDELDRKDAALLSAEATARREGERAGREAMREEAAQHHDRMKGIGTRAFEEQHRHDAIAIRALPISTTGGE